MDYCRGEDKRNQKLIAAGYLCNEEYCRERRLHHACHEAAHANQNEVGNRNLTGRNHVDYHGHNKATYCTHEQCGTEGSANSSAGSARGLSGVSV